MTDEVVVPASVTSATTTTDSVTDRVPRPGSHKIAVGMVGGAVTIVFVWLMSLGGVIVPTPVAQALGIIIGALLSIAVPDDMEAP